MKYLLEEWALKGGILTQLEEALLYLGKREVIHGMLYLTVNFINYDLSVEQDIISFLHLFIVRFICSTREEEYCY